MKDQTGSGRHSKAATETPLRLGLGEYETIDNDGARASLQDLRSLFLITASRAKPELASDLDELLGLYAQIPLFCFTAKKNRRKWRDPRTRFSWSRHCRPEWRYIEDAWQNYIQNLARPNTAQTRFELKFDDFYDELEGEGMWLSAFNVPPHSDPSIEQFIIKLFDWSINHGLDAMWCRQFAYETLDLWSQSERYRNARFWWYTTAHVSRPGQRDEWVMLLLNFEPRPQEFVFKWSTLFPVEGFRGKEKKLITEKFRQELDAFLDRCEDEAEGANLVSVLHTKTREHLEWLADFQVKQMGYKEVYEANVCSTLPTPYSSDDTKTVRQAINKLARLIQLPLRREATRPGRRPKR